MEWHWLSTIRDTISTLIFRVMEKNVKELAEYVAKAYGFLLTKYDLITGERFSQLIKGYYDSSEPRHQKCAEAASMHIKYVQKLSGGIVVWFNE